MNKDLQYVRGLAAVFVLLAVTGCKEVDLAKGDISTIEEVSLQTVVESTAPDQDRVIVNGDTVLVQFVTRLADGKIVGRTEDGKALTVVAGEKSQMPGLETVITGMHVNETKNVRIAANDAFGSHNADLVRKFERSDIPSDIEPIPGMVLRLTNAEGRKIAAMVTKVEEQIVHVDLNHPLAGKDLFMSVKVVSVQ